MRFAKGGDVWAIEQADKTLAISEGGKTVVRRFVSAEHAAKQLAKLVADKLAAGYVETADAPPPPRARSREDELLDDIVANPDAVDAYAVLADHLVERDDRRGELIALQLAAERDPKLRDKVERYLRKHAPRILGPLARRLDDVDDPDGPATWRRGFVDTLVVNRKRMQGDLAELLDDLLAAPALRLLRRVVLRCGRDDLRQACAVVAHRAPPVLRELELYGRVPELDGLLRALPALRHLAIIPRNARPETTERSPALDSLATAPMPAMHRLELECSFPDEVTGLFARADLPELRELRLHLGTDAELVLGQLADGPLAPQLEVLDLGYGWHRDGDVSLLLARRERFSRLRDVVMMPNHAGDSLAGLRAAFRVQTPRARAYDTDDDLDEDDDEDHYDDIDE